MRHPLTYLLPLLLLGIMFIGCTDQPVATNDPESLQASGLEKVIHNEYSYSLVLDGGEVFGCATGERMTSYGTIEVYIYERTTPSGNTTLSGYSDYFHYPGDPVRLVGNTSGTVWTLVKAQNHFGEVYKDNKVYPEDFFIQHFEWHEFYQNEDGDMLRLFVEGMMKINSDGTIKIDNFHQKCF